MSNELINLLREDIRQLSRDVKSTEEAWRDRSHELNDKIQVLALKSAIQDKQIDALEEHPGLDAIAAAMRDGFEGCHKRLDKVNGRLDRHEGEIGALRGAASVEQPVSGRAKAAVVGGASIGGLAVLYSLFEMIKSVGPAIAKLFGG